VPNPDCYSAEFRLKNTGEIEARSPTVSIRLPEHVGGKPFRDPRNLEAAFRDMSEVREDFFESEGRVAIIKPAPLLNPLLLPDHSVSFIGLAFRLSKHPLGSEISLEYRVDAEDMTPVTGVIKCKVPDNEADIVSHK
jgi:hypothetical protein